MAARSRYIAAGAGLALVGALGIGAHLAPPSRLAPSFVHPVLREIRDGFDSDPQPFRIIADLDGDAIPDTFGYAPGPPWHTVRFASHSRRWEARPGEGLEELFAATNEQLRIDLESRVPDPVKRRVRLARYRICADNVEHGPVASVGGRLVVMWYMEPLYPAGINTYDLDGRLLSRYVHPGHLRCMTPVETPGGWFLVFGGTNNFLDRDPAGAAGRVPLHLPIVGGIALGANGLDPGLARVLAVAGGIRLEIARVPLYEAVDCGRNSQVVRLRPLGEGCRIAAEYEPGSVAGGGYAEHGSTAIVNVCGASPRSSRVHAFGRHDWAENRVPRFQWPS
jgi:hypothetical protein